MKKYLISIVFALCAMVAFGQSYPKESFRSNNGSVDIWCVNHGSVVISAGDCDIFVDPVSNYYGKAISYDDFLKSADRQRIVLVCHEHGDHLDKDLVKKLLKANASLFANQASIKQVGEGKVLANGEKAELNVSGSAIDIKAVPAYNYTKGHTNFHPKGKGNGYLITIDGLNVYVAGDTEDIPELGDLGPVDVALLPVNQPYTMTPEQCVKAAKVIKPKVLIPYHLGDTDTSEIVSGLEGTGIDIRLHEELR